MPRAFLVVMDSVGIGGAPDAGDFFNAGKPDTGANTLAHIAQAAGPLKLPNLDRLGLGAALALASGEEAPGLGAAPEGLWGVAQAEAPGKDTVTGHWELAGLRVHWTWTHFPLEEPSFPEDLVERVKSLAGGGRHPRQSRGLGHRDHRRAWSRACPHRKANLLHLGRQRLPDSGA